MNPAGLQEAELPAKSFEQAGNTVDKVAINGHLVEHTDTIGHNAGKIAKKVDDTVDHPVIVKFGAEGCQ